MCTDAGGPVAPDAAPPDAAPEEDNCAAPDGGRIVNPADTCPDGGTDDDGGMDDEVAPHYGSSADDDDCKTHVTYGATCVQRNQNVTFTVTQRNLTSNMNMTGAKPYIEAFIGNHPITLAGAATENNGVYTISGVQFDRAGIWTVRFHFFGDCADGDDSKHTHVAFYVRVP